MLDAHFCAGDGRVNENIGLTAIHQIFHSEHDRLVADIKNVLTNDTSDTGVAALPEWKPDSAPTAGTASACSRPPASSPRWSTSTSCSRSSPARSQPAINPFEPFAFTQTELNPAIKAEFAHAVYRFGHSMLTDSVGPRSTQTAPTTTSRCSTRSSTRPSTRRRRAGGCAHPRTGRRRILMGASDQIGNELDEFVTETLRNNLLGLPLDLADDQHDTGT